jgi:mono/diheme cytochrome c family protein
VESRIFHCAKPLGAVLFIASFLPVLSAAVAPTYYKDVFPILQNHCQECHRRGELAPMPLGTYGQVRPWAKAIRRAVLSRSMPPWFADPCCGKFANERTLSQREIQTIVEWVDSGAPPGSAFDATSVRQWPKQGSVTPDVVLQMPTAFAVPSKGAVDYQSFVIPTGFTEDRWVQAAEVLPGARTVIHHVVVYIREPGDTWTKGPTQSDILALYAPGSSPSVWPRGMGKLVPKGSDLVMEIHYTPNGSPALDRSKVAIAFSRSKPQKRVLSLQLHNTKIRIPPGERDYHLSAWGTMPNDALLLGFLPHMHLRGKAFEYDRILDNGQIEPLLRVSKYNFHWQLSYRLAEPIPLKKGTRLSITGWFDNSANNPDNPDPSEEVRWGEQSWQEMMVGFFDVAVDPAFDRKSFFVRE